MDEINIKKNFSNNLIKLRKSRNYSQKDLGDKLNYSYKNVSKWETGETLPDIYTLKNIADVFDVTVDDLISQKDGLIKKSYKNRNKLLITILSSLLPYVISLIIFIILNVVGYKRSYYSFIYGGIASAITFIVFSSIFYSKKLLQFAIIYLVIMISILIMMYINYQKWYLFIVADVIIAILLFVFFKIKFKKEY